METLFVEEDILIRILLPLDVISLKSIESSSLAFWNFTKRTKLWRRKFHEDNPNFFDNSALSEDILLREKSVLGFDDHFKFKRLSLKYHSLLKNWKTKNFIKKAYKISSKIDAEEKLMSINSKFLLTTTRSEFFNSLRTIYDLNNFSVVKTFETEPKYQVLSADFTKSYVVMFGEQQLVGDPAGLNHHDYNFCVKVFREPRYEVVCQSVLLHDPEFTVESRVQLCGEKVVLFVSQCRARDLNTGDHQDSLHIFTFSEPGLKFMKHERKITLRLPRQKYLSIFHFDSQNVIGSRKKNTLVEVWSLETCDLVDDCWTAPVMWSSDVGYGNVIKCSSVYYRDPLAYIGKSNGRCDLWDCRLDLRLRSLLHYSGPQTERHLLVTRILLTTNHLLSLTSEGKLFVWDRQEVEEVGLGHLDLNMTDPLWTSASLVRGHKIVSVFSDETKLVTLVSGPRQADTSILMYDFWHHRNNGNYGVKLNRKTSFSDNSGPKKRRSKNSNM